MSEAMPAKFRKRPVVIEAMQFKIGNCDDALEWCNAFVWQGKWHIHTLEGDLLLTPGDWIIKGIKGEFYPCKPDIFEATYEPLD